MNQQNSNYRALSTQTLTDMLRDMSRPEQDPDPELLNAVTAELNRRRGAPETEPKTPPRRIPKAVRRIGLILAVLILIVWVTPITHTGSIPFVRWINGSFSVGHQSIGTYASLQEALDAYGVTEKLMPKWLPPEYCISEVTVDDLTLYTVFFAEYNSIGDSDDHLAITIREYTSEGTVTIHEKDDTPVEAVTTDSCTYYITYDNDDWTSIIWNRGPCEGNIFGKFSQEDAYHIIDSME